MKESAIDSFEIKKLWGRHFRRFGVSFADEGKHAFFIFKIQD